LSIASNLAQFVRQQGGGHGGIFDLVDVCRRINKPNRHDEGFDPDQFRGLP
jgi:hypothetical protein